MVNTSESYNVAIKALSRRFQARITVGVNSFADEIRTIVQTAGSCGEDSFSIGTVFASYVDVTLSMAECSFMGKEVFIEIGLYLPDGTLEYVPLGYYTITPNDVLKTGDQITVKGTDRIASKCSGLYVPTVTFPATVGQVIDDIEAQAGITVETFLDTTGVIEIPMENLLYREALGFLAGLLGGFCYADRYGNIRIAAFPGTMTADIDADRCLDDTVTEEENYSVSAVTVNVKEGGEDADGNQIAGVSYTAGTGEGIAVSNPYMTEALFAAMKERVLNYAFRPGTAVFLGDPRLGPEDVIQVVDYTGETCLIPCMYIVHDYDGGLTTTVTAPGQAASDEGVQGPLTKQVERLASEMVLAKEVIAKKITADEANLKYATVENLTVLNQTVESISGDYASFKTMTTEELSALSARIDSITATTITTEYLDAHYANLDLANVDTANIRQGFLESLMVSQGVVADRVVGGEIVATDVLTGVNLYANDITAGTLSVDRLVIRGSEKSIVYELNSIDGAEQLASTETLNGEILTPRTITADRIVAESITSNEINVADLVATGLVEANRLTANNINVTSLSSLSANIGQLTIDGYLTTNTARTSYNQAAAGMTMDKNGVGGWGSETQYWNMTTGGQLTAAGVDINGKITATSLNIIGGSATFRMPNNMAALGAGTLKFERIYTEDSGFAWDSKTGTVVEDVASSVAYLALRFSSSSALIYTDGSIRADGTVYSEGVQATTIGAESFSGESVYANNIDVRSIVFHGGTGQYAAAIAFDDTAAGTLCIGDSLLSTMTLIADRVYVTADEIELNGTVSANSISEGGTALSSKYAAKSHTHSYLPLSGGTVTGATTINATTTIARYLYMGASTTTNTDRQIIFRVDSGTYLHCSYFYGGSSSSTTAIGAYDSRNSRGIWAYNDKDNMFTVTPPAQMLGTLKVTGAATLNSTLTVAGSTTISGQISVTGAIKCQNAYDNTVTNAANLYITSNYNFRRSTASSKRYKHDIAQLRGELDARKLLNLPVKQYVYNLDYLSEEDLRYGKAIPGFIAEDVAEIYPIAAEYADGVVEDWNIRLIVPPILALVQEEYAELTAHAARLDTAEARIESLQAQLDQAQEEIAKLKEQLKAAA